jgi:hypothetical protein
VDDSPEQNITDHPQMKEIFRRQMRLEQATHAVRSKIKGLQEKEQQILKKHHEWMANDEEKKLKQEADTAAQQRRSWIQILTNQEAKRQLSVNAHEFVPGGHLDNAERKEREGKGKNNGNDLPKEKKEKNQKQSKQPKEHSTHLEDCAICLQPDNERSPLWTDERVHLECHHNFHSECLHGWIVALTKRNASKTCPMCRADIHPRYCTLTTNVLNKTLVRRKEKAQDHLRQKAQKEKARMKKVQQARLEAAKEQREKKEKKEQQHYENLEHQ